MEVYKKYGDLLNKAAEIEVANFIKEEHDLDEYVTMITRYEVTVHVVITQSNLEQRTIFYRILAF